MGGVVEALRDLRGVVAEEVDRFADLGQGIAQRLARLAHQQPEQRRRRASSRSAARCKQAARAAGGMACQAAAAAVARAMAASTSAGVAQAAWPTRSPRSAGLRTGCQEPTAAPGGAARQTRPALSRSASARVASRAHSSGPARRSSRGPARTGRAARQCGDAARPSGCWRPPAPPGRRRAPPPRHSGLHAVDEGGVGAVLQQPAHQVGQQRLMRADGGIDAAGAVQLRRPTTCS